MKIISEGTQYNANLPSGFAKLLPNQIFEQLLEMNNSKEDIAAWNKRNIMFVFMFFMLFAIFAIFTAWQVIFIGLLIGGLFFYNQMKAIKLTYQQFRFERQLEFAKFARLIIPLLKQYQQSINLRAIFEKIVPRLAYEVDRQMLQRLIVDMSYLPGSYEPFDNFAKQMSGTDGSYLFMSTLADLDQGSIDLLVIDRLGKMASEEMMQGIDQIVEFKIKGFSGTFGKMVGTIIILVFGFGISLVIYKIGEVGFFF